MRRAAPWLAGTALVLAAGVATALTPGPESLTGAFLVHGAAGEAVSSRTLTAQVHESLFADHITVEDDGWSADGNWLVLRLSVSAPHDEEDAQLRLAKLVIGDREYLASERAGTTLVNTDLRVGIDTTGMLVFELPPALETDSAELRLSLPYATPHLDDVVVIPLDLTDADRETSVEIAEPVVEGMP
ncbi:hypothetical protein ACWGJP_08380 [Microbacterium sp. NPDC055903]